MTIVEAISRVANRHADALYAGLSAQGMQEAIDAVNAALMELYRLLPPHYRNTALSLPVEAAVTLSMEAVNGSATLAADAFTASQIGRTVTAGGDPAQHRVAAANALRDVWLGPTGTTQATVYHDYVWDGDYPFDRLLTDPVLLAGSTECRLERIDPDTLDMTWLRGVGRPRYYWLEDGGVSGGNDVVVAIRLLPMPVAACRLRVRASYWPRRVRFPDVTTNAPLPIPDAVAEAFLDLAGAHVAGLSGWERVRAGEALAKAEAARAQIDSMPKYPGLRRNRVGTPCGY